MATFTLTKVVDPKDFAATTLRKNADLKPCPYKISTVLLDAVREGKKRFRTEDNFGIELVEKHLSNLDPLVEAMMAERKNISSSGANATAIRLNTASKTTIEEAVKFLKDNGYTGISIQGVIAGLVYLHAKSKNLV